MIRSTDTPVSPSATGLVPLPATAHAAAANATAPERIDVSRFYAGPVHRLFVFVLLALLLSQTALSLWTWSIAERRFMPELQRKGQAVANALSNQLSRTLGEQTALQQLPGIQALFAKVLDENDDLAYLALRDRNGALLAEHGSKPEPVDEESGVAWSGSALVLQGGVPVGQVQVAVNRQFVERHISGLRYDIGIVLLTSLLIAFELLLVLVALNLTASMHQIFVLCQCIAAGDFRFVSTHTHIGHALGEQLHALQARLNHAYAELRRLVTEQAHHAHHLPLVAALERAYLFAGTQAQPLAEQRLILVRILTALFMFAEMLSRPFMPNYAVALDDHGLGLSEGLRAGIPIALFQLGVALSMPLAGRWSDRVGRRNSYLLGALLVACALSLTALVPDYFVLLLGRLLAGCGYATLFMSCQGFVLDNTEGAARSKGLALFVGAIAVAETCAPAVGGVLADRLGNAAVFGIGAAVALLAGWVAYQTLDDATHNRQDKPLPLRQQLAVLAGNTRFWTLTFLSGIPAKFFYTSYIMFLVPVVLKMQDFTPAEIGRYVLPYGLMAAFGAPAFTWLGERRGAHALHVAGGALLTGLGMLPLFGDFGPGSVLLGIFALGLGQALSTSSQLVLVTRSLKRPGLQVAPSQLVGVFQLLERLGSATGPVVAGLLVAAYGPQHAMTLLGVAACTTAVAFASCYYLSSHSNDQDTTLDTSHDNHGDPSACFSKPGSVDPHAPRPGEPQ